MGMSRGTQGQAALTAVADVLKEPAWFIIVHCFFTVGRKKFLQLSFLWSLFGRNWLSLGL